MDAAKEKLKQAASLFEEVATALTVPNPDLVICARKCLRATDLLEWHDQSMWLNLELEGYPTGAELPNYRIIPASLVYQSPKYLAEILAEQPDELRPQKINIPLPYPISDLIRARKSGYKTQTGNQKESYISYLKKGIVAEEFLKIDPIEIERALDHITNRLFEIARRGAILLLYGETITSVFEKYQSLVNDK